jgi:hypothetical protein
MEDLSNFLQIMIHLVQYQLCTLYTYCTCGTAHKSPDSVSVTGRTTSIVISSLLNFEFFDTSHV